MRLHSSVYRTALVPYDLPGADKGAGVIFSTVGGTVAILGPNESPKTLPSPYLPDP
jgi:hypothetical protein